MEWHPLGAIWFGSVCICYFVRNFGVWNFRTFYTPYQPWTPISARGPQALGLIWVFGWYGVWYENCHIIIYLSYIFLSDKFAYLIWYMESMARLPSAPNVELWVFCPGVLVYLAPWAACPPGVKLPLGSLPPRGWRYPGVSCPPPWAACPLGVKLPLGSLPPGGEDTLAWVACPPPQENLTELNAERFYFFF